MPRKKIPWQAICESVVAQLPCFVTLADRQGKVRWLNRVSYGYRKKDLLGRSGSDPVAPESRPRWEYARQRALDLLEIVEDEIQIAAPGLDAPFTLHFRVAPLRHEGQVVGTVTIAWDVGQIPSKNPSMNHHDNPALRFLLAPEGKNLVRFFLTCPPEKRLHADALARQIGEARSGHATARFRTLLADLTARGVLANDSLGYGLASAFRPFAPAASED